MPAVREMFGNPIAALWSLSHMDEGRANKQDLKNLMRLLPIPNFIPFMTYIDKYVNQSSYPDKRPRKKTSTSQP